MWRRGIGELEPAGHIDLDFAVWGHVRGEQRVQAALVLVGEARGPGGRGSWLRAAAIYKSTATCVQFGASNGEPHDQQRAA